jgi:hypothetical protein
VRTAIGADALAGIAAVTLGVLGIARVEPSRLLPVGALLLGAGLLLSAGGPVAGRGAAGRGRADELARDALAASSGVHVLAGAGALVLGLIGVLGSTPVLMSLVATLGIGAAQLLTGASLGGRTATVLGHRT